MYIIEHSGTNHKTKLQGRLENIQVFKNCRRNASQSGFSSIQRNLTIEQHSLHNLHYDFVVKPNQFFPF